MAGSSVIADIGLSIVQVIRSAMVPELIDRSDGVGMAHPSDKGDLNMSIYLFEVKENTEVRSNDLLDEGDMLRYPPIALDLSYLITAHSSSDVMTRAIDEQRMMGRVIQLLHDHNVLKGDDLAGSLAGSDGIYRLVKEELPLETLMSFFPNAPYKFSVCYKAGPVFLDSTRTKPASRVRERHFALNEKK